jgi:hypothetical protein
VSLNKRHGFVGYVSFVGLVGLLNRLTGLTVITLLLAVSSHAVSNFCPVLSAPAGRTIVVSPSQASELPSIIAGAASGTTLLLQDGTYSVPDLPFRTSGVTMRGQSGNRDAVILDGNYTTAEVIRIYTTAITIADLTVQRAVDHNIHLAGNASNALIYNVHLIDSGEQFMKGSDVPYNDNVTVACSLFEMTPAGRSHVELTSQAHAGIPCYTGGIDAHEAAGWTVRDNIIQNIWCSNGLAEHGIHFWNGGRDQTIERNVLVNNARGIGLGLTNGVAARTYSDNPPGALQNMNGVIRNNFVYGNIAQFDTGIGLEQAYNASVYHNTVLAPSGTLTLDVRFSNSVASVQNNLFSGAVSLRDAGSMKANAGNVVNATASMFVNPGTGDLHLVSGATGANKKGVNMTSTVPADIDGDTRAAQPDAGADEFSTGTPPPGTACDMNRDNATNVSDVQQCVNQAIGTVACNTGDINNDGACNVVDVQRVVNAALGGQCVTQ